MNSPKKGCQNIGGLFLYACSSDYICKAGSQKFLPVRSCITITALFCSRILLFDPR